MCFARVSGSVTSALGLLLLAAGLLAACGGDPVPPDVLLHQLSIELEVQQGMLRRVEVVLRDPTAAATNPQAYEEALNSRVQIERTIEEIRGRIAKLEKELGPKTE